MKALGLALVCGAALAGMIVPTLDIGLLLFALALGAMLLSFALTPHPARTGLPHIDAVLRKVERL